MMTEYYEEKLQVGLEYQDFITCLLIEQLGISLSTFQSRKYQYTGENKQGIEIKFDDKMRSTGNVYIEVAEKSNPNKPAFVPSGIYRNDNSWLYIIGDYSTVFVFSKKHLVLMHKAEKFRVVEIPTSRGFLIPVDTAERYCLKRLSCDRVERSKAKKLEEAA